MTEKEMLERLEELRKASEHVHYPVYAMGNGSCIMGTVDVSLKERFKEVGYWVVSIFENGHRVGA